MKNEYKDKSWAHSNDVFRKAAFFFYKEKIKGSKGKLAPIMKKKSDKVAFPCLSDITTDGKTYLKPSDCRKSLATIFKKYDLTQSKLAKMIGENPVMVGRFLSDGGEFGGSEKSCYHPLAMFCEKVRIATGTKKSRKRLAIEAEGRDQPFLGHDSRKRYLVMQGERLHLARDAAGRSVVRHG